MSVDVHSGGVFLGVDCVLDFFKGYKTKASGFLSLLIVDKLTALEQLLDFWNQERVSYLEFSVTLENSSEFLIGGSSTKIENTLKKIMIKKIINYHTKTSRFVRIGSITEVSLFFVLRWRLRSASSTSSRVTRRPSSTFFRWSTSSRSGSTPTRSGTWSLSKQEVEVWRRRKYFTCCQNHSSQSVLSSLPYWLLVPKSLSS